jgi:hypothetical protein
MEELWDCYNFAIYKPGYIVYARIIRDHQMLSPAPDIA